MKKYIIEVGNLFIVDETTIRGVIVGDHIIVMRVNPKQKSIIRDWLTYSNHNIFHFLVTDFGKINGDYYCTVQDATRFGKQFFIRTDENKEKLTRLSSFPPNIHSNELKT